jgi:hypothetical protein
MAKKIRAKRQDKKNSRNVSRSGTHQKSLSKKPGEGVVARFQKQYGNNAVHRMHASGMLQAKLKIGRPGDKYEREADNVADRVMNMPELNIGRQEDKAEEIQANPLADQITPLAQRQIEEEGKVQSQPEEEEQAQAKFFQRQEEEEEPAQAKFLQRQEEEEEPAQAKLLQRQEEEEEPVQAQFLQRQEEEEEQAQPKLLQRQEEEEEPAQAKLLQRQEEEEELQAQTEEEEEPVQAKSSSSEAGRISPAIESGIKSIRGGGRRLSESTRSFFEPRFGRNFSGVRIHADSNANHMARSLSAMAFTVGQDVVFGSGQYSPGSRTGRSLLAHELTHVVQQSRPGNARIMRRVRYSSRRKYGYKRRDATVLYGSNRAPNLVPASGFNQQNTRFRHFAKRWKDGLGITRLNQLGGDCGLYARELIRRTGRTPRSYATATRPGIGLARANDLRPGEAYYIRPRGTGAGGVVENILSPWNNTVRVRKHLTKFHVATVVAKDNRTVFTSEVNSAFPGHVRPWFSMYRGNRGFYRTFRREYRRGRTAPGLWSM